MLVKKSLETERRQGIVPVSFFVAAWMAFTLISPYRSITARIQDIPS
jgi:hypothetical protein